MGETRPSMIRSCRVWLGSRQDISEEKRNCINSLFARAEPVEVVVRGGKSMICPSCGSGISSSIKFCGQCGQRVNARRESVCSRVKMDEVIRRRSNGETISEIADDLGISSNTLGVYLYRHRSKSDNIRKNVRYTVKELMNATERHDNGETWESIGASTGRNPCSLSQAVRKFYKNKEDIENGK